MKKKMTLQSATEKRLQRQRSPRLDFKMPLLKKTPFTIKNDASMLFRRVSVRLSKCATDI